MEKCLNCNTDFERKHNSQKHCCRKCWKSHYNKAYKLRQKDIVRFTPEIKICLCGNEFLTKCIAHKHCSEICRKKYRKEYRKKYRTSPEGKAAVRESDIKYAVTPTGKITRAKASIKYSRTTRAKVNRVNWRKTSNGKISGLLGCAKHRAKKKGLSYNLTPEWLRAIWEEQKGKCTICKVAHSFDLEHDLNHFFNPDAPSLDRIDSKQGYIKENTRLVCTWYNMAKGELSDENFRCRAVNAFGIKLENEYDI